MPNMVALDSTVIAANLQYTHTYTKRKDSLLFVLGIRDTDYHYVSNALFRPMKEVTKDIAESIMNRKTLKYVYTNLSKENSMNTFNAIFLGIVSI